MSERNEEEGKPNINRFRDKIKQLTQEIKDVLEDGKGDNDLDVDGCFSEGGQYVDPESREKFLMMAHAMHCDDPDCELGHVGLAAVTVNGMRCDAIALMKPYYNDKGEEEGMKIAPLFISIPEGMVVVKYDPDEKDTAEPTETSSDKG